MTTKIQNITTEEKLRLLCALQLIDSSLDEIKSLQGDLPLETNELENDLNQIDQKRSSIEEQIKTFENQIGEQKKLIEEANKLIQKYSIQKDNVRNDREFNTLEKEIEYQELEIQLLDKKIRGLKSKKEKDIILVSEMKDLYENKKEVLEYKKKALSKIIEESFEKEKMLLEEAGKIEEKIDKNLLEKYKRIRNKVEDGLAVVTVERGASGGSFLLIPVQKCLRIFDRREILLDEHTGRILVDKELMEEEKNKLTEFSII